MKEIIENKTEINLPDNLQTLSEATRESIYYLNSLEVLFKEHIVLTKDHNNELYSERLAKIIKYREEFDELENLFYYPIENQVLANGTYKIELETNEFVNSVIKYIKLKEQVDKLQYVILKYLFEIGDSIIKNFISGKEYLDALSVKYHTKLLTYSAFEHSKDEDKYDNYRIHLSDKKTARDYSKINEYPIRVKVRNYNFNIEKYRNLYKLLKDSEIEIIYNSSKIKEEQHIYNINIQQFEINKKLKKLGIYGFIFALLSVIFTFISTCYSIKDHNTNGPSDNKTEKAISNDNIKLESKLQNNLKYDSSLSK